NYLLTFNGANVTVTQRPLTVTAVGQTRRYGDGNDPLGFTTNAGGLVNGDTVALATTATKQSSVGAYPITLDTLTNAGNYLLTFNGANVTVTQRPLTVTAVGQTRRYGDGNDPLGFTTNAGGLVNGDAVTLATTATKQ